MRSLHARLQVN